MTISKRTLMTLATAGFLGMALPVAGMAADIKGMAESLVNLTVKDKNKLVFNGNIPEDVLSVAAGLSPEKRAEIYAKQFEAMTQKALGGGGGAGKVTFKELTVMLNTSCCDRVMESVIELPEGGLVGVLTVKSVK